MRAGINALFLARPMTGTGRYTRRLLSELARKGAECECLAFGPPGSAGRWPGMRLVSTPFDGRSEGLAKLYFEQIAFPVAGRRSSAELVHYPYFAAPISSSTPVVATVHDLIPVLLPQYRTSAAVRLYTLLVTLACRRARLLITDSWASQRDIVRHLRVPAERIRVVCLAADEQFRPNASPSSVAVVRRRYELPEEFVLYLGGLDYRKNVPKLLEALVLMGKQGTRPHLVIAGALPTPSRLFPDVRRLVAELELDDQVHFCGPPADEDVPLLYQAATAFAFPSLYEGFGLPPLEAMACGTPVVCSNASSLPEVVGDAALTVDPTDAEALAGALQAVLADGELRAELKRRGLSQSALFAWDRVGRETLQAYAAALKRQEPAHHAVDA